LLQKKVISRKKYFIKRQNCKNKIKWFYCWYT